MIFLLFFVFLYAALYALMISFFYLSWKQVKTLKLQQQPISKKVTVIIPARNEAKNIGNILADLSKQNYSKSLFEIIVIDDHSKDATADIVNAYEADNLYLIKLKDVLKGEKIYSYKKKAIETGIAKANNEIIVTTDADCRLQPNWLQLITAPFANEKINIVAGPVVYFKEKNLLHYFESLDILGLAAITAGMTNKGLIGLCNGANLAYRKRSFDAVNGFEGIDSIASGDDMLLLQKIRNKFPGSVFYLKSKEATVYTYPSQSFENFIHQRIRWISKAKYYLDNRVTPVLIFAYIYHLMLLLLLITGIFDTRFLILFLIGWFIKLAVEYVLLTSSALFFRKYKTMNWFLPAQFLYIFYVVIAGILGIFTTYKWKGRTVK